MVPPELITEETFTGETITLLKFTGDIKVVEAWLEFKCEKAYEKGKQEALSVLQKQARQLFKDIFAREV